MPRGVRDDHHVVLNSFEVCEDSIVPRGVRDDHQFEHRIHHILFAHTDGNRAEKVYVRFTVGLLLRLRHKV